MLRCTKSVIFAVILFSNAAGLAQAARLTLEKSQEELMRNQSTTTTTTTVSPANLPIFREAADHGEFEHKVQGTSKRSNETATLNAVKARLMKELKEVLQSENHKKGLIQVELEDDNIEEWNVKLFYPEDGRLHRDLAKLKRMGREDHIKLHISFANGNYPSEVPFVRVVYPVLSGVRAGALCLDILTKHGWNASFTCEAFILTLMSAFQGTFVQLEKMDELDDLYTEEKARIDFKKIQKLHEREEDW